MAADRAVLVLLSILGALWIGLEAGYRIGNHAGYSQGWSDANCGPHPCEAGQE